MDGLQQHWPEPVVRVQSLSESGAAVIPARYIKPPSDRPSLDLTGITRVVPVIDLATLIDGTGAATVRAVSEACRDWGFFQVVNHGVSPGLMTQTRAAWREFFALPMAAKQLYGNSPGTYEGYGSRTGVEEDAVLDWSDYFFLYLLPNSINSLLKWPAFPISCRETIEEYGREVVKLCEILMRVISLSLGLDAGYLQEAFGGDEVGACMRASFYPKCPQPELTLGLSPHSDPGGITVLLADDHVASLQVRKDGGWVTIRPTPNAFIINIGDQLQILSNGIYKSVEHRVIANAMEERLSVALFYNPRSDLPLGPAPELVTPERPALYQPMTFNEYRMYVRMKGPQGKSQVELLKAI